MLPDLDELERGDRPEGSERQLRELAMAKSDELYRAMNSTAARFIKWSLAKDHFIMEVMGFMRETDHRVYNGELTPLEGIWLYQQEIDSLRRQEQALIAGQREQFIVVHKDELQKTLNSRDKRVQLAIAGVGFISGGLQMVAGFATIETGAGGIMLAHGFNNVIENGYYLLYRESFVGPVRFVYRGVAAQFGIDNRKADAIYAAVDVGLSINSMLGTRLTPDAERLYRFIDADLLTGLKHKGIRLMSLGDVILEVFGDVSTISGVYESYR